ncbi:TonB-dependent receptor plug domain-containing protein [Brevundimonas diminuta]|uniref:TonB-dependent receptor plug domain-containing protein n=1 Tax=Brevundimonas diminuta TaxID=293 RepID=UPI0037C74D62
MFRRRSRAALFSSATALALAAFTAPVAVMAQAATYNFDIPAQDLGSALRAFGQASRQQVVFDSELVRGRTSSALVGSFSADDGIRRLLEGTGLVANRGRSGVLVISTTSNGRDRAAVPERVDDIIVTGTHIQGALPTAPVISITRADIEDAGYGNVGEVIRSLPQNFSGGQNPGVIGATAGSGVNANTSNASTINLRGLGTDATLVLVNGRRLSGDTYLQGSDISGIPLGAINRIEIVTDGSSAVYGSDAVAGVANFVLRKDYDGLELSARLGTSTQGGGEEQTYSVLAGHSRPEWYAM